jgi:hypothetical protein
MEVDKKAKALSHAGKTNFAVSNSNSMGCVLFPLP